MSIFKRISATVASSIDHMVGEIENHEAVVEASLEDLQKKIATAKVRLSALNRDKQSLEKKLHDIEEKAKTWKARAVQTASENQDKALQCLSRSKQCEQQSVSMQKSLQEYETAAHKLISDIEQSELKLSDMRQKHTIMRARQSTSSALNAANRSCEDNTQKMLDDTFDRWEVNIVESELAGNSSLSSIDSFADSLEQDFIKQENKTELSMELEALLKEKDHD